MRFGSLALVLALSSSSLLGCGGGGTDESVSGVFPSSAFLGRTLRVEISGDATNWKDGTTLDFGAGVTVTNVKVASPTAVFAEITVAPDAAPGLRDVIVTDGGDRLVLAEAFQLESAITLKFNGSVAQGSVASFAINNHDFDTPFDDTATGDGFFTPIEYVNTSIEAPAGVQLAIGSMDRYSITGTAFFDIDAVSGPIVVNSGLDENLVVSNLGTPMEVAARTATALSSGVAAMGTVANPLESSLYEFTPTGAPVLASVRASATSQSAEPGVVVLGPSGKFTDFIGYDVAQTLVQETASKFYVIYFDNTGASGYNFTVRANSQMMTPLAEAEPNNTTAAAPIAAAIPFLFRTATLASLTDVDWIGINVAAGDVGKKVRVKTFGNDPQTDTLIEMFAANGTTPFGSPSSDQNYHEDFTSPAITAAGRLWVKVSASQEGFFQPTHNTYTAAIWVE